MILAQPRRPAGVPTGGQWAPAHHDEPDGVCLGAVGLDEVDEIVPQANSPEKVVLTVDAIADGCSTSKEIADALGVDPRQGAYYATASRSLGLVDHAGPGRWALTPEGARAAQSETEDLVALLDARLDKNPHVAVYIDDGEEALAEEWSTRGDIGPETIARRIATIRSWAEYRTSDDATRLARLSACRKEVSDRQVSLRPLRLAQRAAKARRSAAPQHGHCKSCGIELPYANTTGICEDCPGPA